MSLFKYKYAPHAFLVVLWLVVCAWQVFEYRDSVGSSKNELINQSKNISLTIGVVLRAQSRFNVIREKRIQASIDELIKSDVIRGITVVDMKNEVVASVGEIPDVEELGNNEIVWKDDIMIMSQVLRLHDGPVRPEKNTIVNPPRSKGNWWRKRVGLHEKLSLFDRSGMHKGPGYMKMLKALIPEEKLKEIVERYGVHRFVFSVSTAEVNSEARRYLQKCVVVIIFALFAGIAGLISVVGMKHSARLHINLVKAREMNKHLREMNTAAAGLAHEIRNPLNVVKGSAQVVSKDEEMPHEVRSLCENIAAETEKMTFKLNEFISYSRPYDPKITKINPGEVIHSVVSALGIDCEEKDVSIVTNIDVDEIMADPDLFKQLLFNVVLNAVQAVNPGGRIELSFMPVNEKCELTISDDGPGVMPIQQEEIFNPYVTYSGQGTGLGLSIARQIVHNHNWDINYGVSELGGAKFIIGGISS